MFTRFPFAMLASLAYISCHLIIAILARVVRLVQLSSRAIVSSAVRCLNRIRNRNQRFDWIKNWRPEDGVHTETPYSGPSRSSDHPRVDSRIWQQLCSTLPEPEVLDFLLACVHAAVRVKYHHPTHAKWPALPSTFPLQPSEVHGVIDSFPPLSNRSTISDLIGAEALRYERFKLLKWLDESFRHQIIPVDGVLRVPEIQSLRQFVQLSCETFRYVKFKNLIKLRGLQSGRAAFHGTPATNLLSILYGGLETGAEEVSYVSHPELAIQYIWYKGAYYDDITPGIMKGWKNSAFKNVVVLLGVEIAREDIEWTPYDRYYSGQCSQSEIVVRHLFVIPRRVFKKSVEKHRMGKRGSVIPHGCQAKATMEKGYQLIHKSH